MKGEEPPPGAGKPLGRALQTSANILGTGSAFACHHTPDAMYDAFLKQRRARGDKGMLEVESLSRVASRSSVVDSPVAQAALEEPRTDKFADVAFAKRIFEACGFNAHSVALPNADLFRLMPREEYIEHRRCCLLRLAELAAERALLSWGGARASITHLYWGTMTGAMDSPTLDIHLTRRLGLDPNIDRMSIEGMGCLTGFRLLNIARQVAAANPSARILVVTADLRSALGSMMPLRPLLREEMISVALFCDSGSACVVGGAATGTEAARYALLGGISRILDDSEHLVRYQEHSDTTISLRLSRELPIEIGKAEYALCIDTLHCAGVPPSVGLDSIDVLCHTGGPRVLNEVAKSIGVSAEQMNASWTVMRGHGNLSGSSNLAVLDEHNHMPTSREWAIGLSCGPGVAIESSLLKRLVPTPAPRHLSMHARPPWWDEEKVQRLRMGLVGEQHLRLGPRDVVISSCVLSSPCLPPPPVCSFHSPHTSSCTKRVVGPTASIRDTGRCAA
jgi:alkylresorcinol/alkylpyrone synthase